MQWRPSPQFQSTQPTARFKPSSAGSEEKDKLKLKPPTLNLYRHFFGPERRLIGLGGVQALCFVVGFSLNFRRLLCLLLHAFVWSRVLGVRDAHVICVICEWCYA